MLPSTLMIVAPILIAATGGLISERAGVVNIALEGLMAIGAM
ncbi:MAG: ABC transporter permease, partial [Treponema sp.]|nr:ABC transporter permease [Treponema sp.]